ncbi:hypothetical protein Pla52o_04930 [Novipirellula galeiformis]|uniref:Sulfatase n=1 Tax=Novipirellula galeiformis TaxID=2528004 RepID=A0A5C6CQ61_9BACT|nr:DUF1501 domain-containing protein [Novipirellula galeiformis]TWU26640.1 hypothetical protein Pla52o_04930 [Novipirellula galeiformis]
MFGCQGYKLSRRQMMAGSAAGATLLGMPIPQLLAASGRDHAATCENVILFWNGGGMSHIDTWDPKPGRPTQGEFAAIRTSVADIQISEIFPTVAKQMHHAALIRSIAGTQGAHERAAYHLQTSFLPGPVQHPGIGSVIAHEKTKRGDLPSFISISGQARTASYLGQRCEAYFIANPGDPDPYLKFPAGVTQQRGSKRLETLERFNGRFNRGTSDSRLTSTSTSIDEAVRLMQSPALTAFELDKVPQRDRERYGDTPFGRGALLAKRLVEQGVRFVQINRGGFDTHGDNFFKMREHGEVMDPALGSLIEDLADSGMIDKTMIIMLSEFGRTPRINEDAGRDHWPKCFSAFLAGGGIHGGTVIGSSDEDGGTPKDNPVQVSDIHASICYALGIDPDKEVITPQGRPMMLVDKGTVIKNLFA